MFDPNTPLPDFASQMSEVEKRREMAKMLRQKAMSTSQPQSQMVGGRYVNPHVLEFLPGLLDKLQAGYAETKASEAEKSFGESTKTARNEWTSSLPRATAAIPARGALPGPPEELGSPELGPREAVPAKLPPRDAILKATLAGINIPGNKEAAMLWNKGMGEEVVREDNQEAKRESLQATLAQRKELELARIEQQIEATRLRSEDARLSIEQRREAAGQLDAFRKMHEQTLLAIASMKAAAGDKEKPLKSLPAAQAKAWVENNKSIKFIDNALEEVEKYPGGLGLTNVLGNAIRSRQDPKGVDVRAVVGNIGSLKVHDRSGAAVTAAETPRLVPFIPQPTDNAATITKKLKLFQREYRIMQDEIVDLADTQGYRSPRKEGAGATPAASAPQATKTIGGKTYIQIDGQWYEK